MAQPKRLTWEQLANRAEWTRQLRGGGWKQAMGALWVRTSDGKTVGHCCLGVARCAEIVCDTPVESMMLLTSDGRALGIERGALGGDVNGKGGLLGHLPGLNDSLGYTFEEIADCIDLDTWYRQEEGE